MRSDKQKGRMDAALGIYAPPFGPWFATTENNGSAARRREEYRAGHYEKRREMEQERERHSDWPRPTVPAPTPFSPLRSNPRGSPRANRALQRLRGWRSLAFTLGILPPQP
jgi:hypothetical protein